MSVAPLLEFSCVLKVHASVKILYRTEKVKLLGGEVIMLYLVDHPFSNVGLRFLTARNLI